MSLAEGAARGSVLAVCKSIGDWLHNRKRKERLRAMLKDVQFEFGRTIGQLAAGIGADHETTRRLLIDVGARPSETNADLWTLKAPPKRLH